MVKDLKTKEDAYTGPLEFRNSYNAYYVDDRKGGNKMRKVTTKKELENEISRISDVSMGLPVGSEEYLNACKAQNQLSEAVGKLRTVDVNQLIPGIASVGMFILYMAFSDTHIMDTRGIQFCKSLFRR